ncbi:MAG: hypothetical protein HYS81_05335 [Candidatus Aenigmatarchaeota archaeon]|nr:MAG: hypothetical protein HYS81_05335 [Candidatus Aenigmarchaeota archaeon]
MSFHEALIPNATTPLASIPTLVTFAVFLVIIYFVYKGVKLGIHLLIMAALGGLFPVVANQYLGFNLPVTIQTIGFYAAVTAFVYLVAHFGRKLVGK